jgi:very-short-patch-repair endonuclease
MLNFARNLRQNLTPAECLLWSRLRRRQVCGFKFRRQHMIGSYICDFVCAEARVIVELDGSQHLDSAPYDADRDRFLRSQGYRILRFWNGDALHRTESVMETIFEAMHRKNMDGRLD